MVDNNKEEGSGRGRWQRGGQAGTGGVDKEDGLWWSMITRRLGPGGAVSNEEELHGRQ